MKGPLAFGLLHDLTHAWTVPLLTLVAATVALLVTGLGAGQNASVPQTDDLPTGSSGP